MGDDPFSYSGGLVVAMKGKDCVAIGTDHKLLAGRMGISDNFKKVFEMGPTTYLGLPGMQTDTLTVHQRLKFRANMYELREGRRLTPRVFGSMVSSFLFEKRFGPYFVNPIVAGIDPETSEPYMVAFDVIGAGEDNEPFATSGTADQYALGLCEALWEPDLSADDLFHTTAQVILQAIKHDCLSGVGATVVVVEKDKITTRTIKTRMD